MNWLDITILVIIALSAGISLLRGFVKESISLATWILAFWIAISFSDRLERVLNGWITSPAARLAVAFAILFILTLIAGALVNYLVSQLVRKTGLSGTDRMLGVIFGIARGIVLVAVLTLMAGIPQLSKETWWKESTLIVYFQDMAIWMKGFLPPDVQKHFVFE